MKQIFSLLFLIVFCSCRKDVLHWQAVEKIETETEIQLNTAVFLADGTGIVGGGGRFEKGFMLISHDKGASWQEKQMPDDSKGFFGSCISPNGNIYFCGLGLNICASTDKMDTYTYNRVAGPYEFTPAISFGEPENGVAVANIKTDSGLVILFNKGLQFTSYLAFKFALHDIKMFDAKNGIAVGSGVVMETGDGGKNWIRQSVTGDNFNSIAALDSKHIFVSGLSGYIIKTIDGGKNWKRLRNGGNISLPNYQLWDLLFLNEQKGYAVGEKGLVIYTDDGGEHWSQFDKFTNNNLRFISLCPDGKLLVGGEKGALYRLTFK